MYVWWGKVSNEILLYEKNTCSKNYYHKFFGSEFFTLVFTGGISQGI